MKKNKFIFIFSVLFLTTGIITFSLGYLLNQFWVRPQLWNQFQQVEKHYVDILKDLELIKTHSIFKNSLYSKNAHTEISKYISWGAGNQIPGSSELFDKNKTLTNWRQTIQSEQKDVLLEKMKDPLVTQTDVVWLEKLLEFDHWNYLDQAEILQTIQQLEKQNRMIRLSKMSLLPSPQYNELWAMATIYWFQKYQQNQVQQGSLVYRKVAELIQTAGDLTAAMVSVAMLKSENNFLQSLSVQVIEPTHKESLEAFKRISWAWSAILNAGWIQKWDSRFEPYLSAQLGLCPAVREQFMGFEAFADFMQPQFPLEVSFDKSYQKFRPFLAQLRTLCHQQPLNPIYTEPTVASKQDPAVLNLPEVEVSSHFKGYHYWPFIRKAVGANYLLIALPNGLKSYQDKVNE